MAGKNVVTLGYGFVGKAVVESFLAAGDNVTVISRTRPDRPISAEFLVADLASADRSLASLREAEIIVFAANSALPHHSEQSPAEDLANMARTLLPVLHALDGFGGLFLFISSGGTVYGEPLSLPIPETHPLRPAGLYGIRNVAAEMIVSAQATKYGFRFSNLRCGNLYGQDQRFQRGQGAVGAFVYAASRGLPITIYGRGSSLRDYLHVGDFGRAVTSLSRLGTLPQTINLATGIGTSTADLARLVLCATGSKSQIHGAPARDFDVSDNVLDITLLRSLISFDPICLAEGIADMQKVGL